MTTIAETIPYNISTNLKKKESRLRVISPTIDNHLDENLIKFLSEYTNLVDRNSKIIRSNILEDLNSFHKNGIQSIINFSRINDVRYIQQYFKLLNAKLPIGGLYIGWTDFRPGWSEIDERKSPSRQHQSFHQL